MHETSLPESEVDQLLRNAHLRDQLEPFFDESIALVDVDIRREPIPGINAQLGIRSSASNKPMVRTRTQFAAN
jgi:hypothetical protein